MMMKRSFLHLIGCALMLLPFTACKQSASQEGTTAAQTDSTKTDSAQAASPDTTAKAAPADTAKATDDKHSETYLKERVEKMYKAAMRGGSVTKNLTRAFRKAYNADIPDGPELGRIDYDIWLRAQDSEHPHAIVKSVKVIDDTHAEARVVVYQFAKRKEHTNVRVSLKFENGDWYVDNFVDSYCNDRQLLRKQ